LAAGPLLYISHTESCRAGTKGQADCFAGAFDGQREEPVFTTHKNKR